MIRDGWYGKEVKNLPNALRVLDKKDLKLYCYTHDIPGLIREYQEAVDFYYSYHRFGDPFGGIGWLNWPCVLYDIIVILGTINLMSEGK